MIHVCQRPRLLRRPRSNAIAQVNQMINKKTSSEGRWRPMDYSSQPDLFPHKKPSKCERFQEWLQSLFASNSSDKYRTDKKKKKPMSFPWWTIYISWTCK